ncbi:MAG TPA: PIN domain-containing protein [Wenzhouxiangellaceae bacterium]|nr:PIN domain-containing protein [Wenzhouxiangellaceae bacterium]
MARLIDTNILVYRIDPRDPLKRRIAQNLLREGLLDDSIVLPHQAVIEFVAAASKPCRDLGGEPLLPLAEALIEAESLGRQFRMLYPDAQVLTAAMYGCATYGMSWFDAHLWAYAQCFGLAEIVSEDFQHGRHYGNVRVVNPFVAGSDQVQELPALYPA